MKQFVVQWSKFTKDETLLKLNPSFYSWNSLLEEAFDWMNRQMFGFKLKKLMKNPNLADRFVNFCMNKWGDFKSTAIKYFPEDHPILKRLLDNL